MNGRSQTLSLAGAIAVGVFIASLAIVIFTIAGGFRP